MTNRPAVINQVKPYTMTSYERLEAMLAALQKIDDEDIEGDIVECGVWRGGNIIMARKVCPERVCWLYDTFSGMTVPGAIDVSKSGGSAAEKYRTRKEKNMPWCYASLDQVRENLADCEVLDDEMLRFIIGDVCLTLQQPSNIPDQIAILRLDTDWYASTKIELEVLYPKLSDGGVLIVDDYGHWNGAKKAVDEFFGGSPNFKVVDYGAILIHKC